MRIFHFHLALPIVALALLETLAFLCVPYAAEWLRFGMNWGVAEEHLQRPMWHSAAWFAGLLLISMVATGLYSARLRVTYLRILVRIAASISIAAVAMALVFYGAPDLDVGGKVVGLSAVLAFIASATIRFVFLRLVDENLFKRRVLVYGCGRQAMSISQLRRRSDQRGFLIVGYVAPAGDRVIVPRERLMTPESSLLAFARQHRIDEIVIAMDDRRRAFPVQELLESRLSGVDVVDLVSFFERETGRIRLDVLNPSWLIFSEGFRRNPVRQFSKRTFDVLASLFLLAITWPLMLIAAFAIRFEDGMSATILYRQNRVGFEGRLFEVLKLRTMRPDAEHDGQARWAQKDDDRITGVGAIMRKIRLDELPQVLNVLKGDMSFVGPRPERPEFVAELNEKIPYYRERHFVKPGITGWAQLCYPYGSSEHDATEKLQYDLYYVKNHSLIFDLIILLQTAEVVFWGKGSR